MPQNANLLAFSAVLVIVGSAAGVFYFQSRQNKQEVIPDNSGFDVAQVAGAAKIMSPLLARPVPNQNSNLGMIKTGMPGLQFGGRAGPTGRPPRRGSDADVAEKVRKSEGRVRSLAERYTKRYPVIARYGLDWMSYPDLEKLNNDYMKNHDPIQFMRGLSQSKNFGILVKKYAREPAIHAFVQDAVKQLPADAAATAMDYLNSNNTIKNFVGNLGSSLGLPLDLLGLGGGKTDQRAVLNSVLKNNPQLQNAQ
ncbi:MAG: hypothetical protein A3J74_04565 [Elusimicrobia bacterium RIFCSPHIGHO2_02_FULL_57_9]|nr:MAG: hypothetical protein A3J74_04565 [Elusimicrobia bacterium RIFCSPHIGHO2_02_FULL_57_9]